MGWTVATFNCSQLGLRVHNLVFRSKFTPARKPFNDPKKLCSLRTYINALSRIYSYSNMITSVIIPLRRTMI